LLLLLRDPGGASRRWRCLDCLEPKDARPAHRQARPGPGPRSPRPEGQLVSGGDPDVSSWVNPGLAGCLLPDIVGAGLERTARSHTAAWSAASRTAPARS